MMPTIALLDLLDRDGHVRQSLPVTGWPVRVGRAIDNDFVLDDAHVAPHHFTLSADEAGSVFVEVGDTLNGVRADGRRVAAAGRAPVGAQPLRIDAGDSHLRLRLASHALAPERLMKPSAGRMRTAVPTIVGALIAILVVGFGGWLGTDPDKTTDALGLLALSSLGSALVWCAAWSVLSKVFTRRAHFWWHLRVLLFAVIAYYAVPSLAALLAFAMSWPWVTDYAFVPVIGIITAMLYFHLLGIEPRHPERMRAAGVALFVAAVGLHLWFNEQARDQPGDELYMSHLFPPGWRLAKPVDTATFAQGLAPLQARLEKKAQKRGDEDDGDHGDGDDDSD